MKILILLILSLSCIKNSNNLKTKVKGINEDLALAIINNDKDKAEKLIKQGANLNYIHNNFNGFTALILASYNGHKEVVELLIKKGADVNDKQKDGWTSLIVASQNGYIEIVKILLEKRANVNDKNIYGSTALILSSQNGHKEVVELLLEKGSNVNDKNNKGYTALMLASENGHKEVIELLLKKRINVNDDNIYGSTALILSSQNGHIETVKILLEKGANVNGKNNKGYTALMLASENGHKEVVELLLEKGANVSYKSNGWTSLRIASHNGHIETVKLLIEKGAGVNEKIEGDDWTSLMLASKNGHKEVIELLIEKGADISDKNNGWTALRAASHNGQIETVKLLVEKGANVNEKIEGDDWTSLMLASKNGHKEVVELLLEKGADVNDNNHDCTALMLASQNRHIEIVKLLIEFGANISYKSKNGDSALSIALSKGFDEISIIIIENLNEIDSNIELNNVIEKTLMDNIKNNEIDKSLTLLHKYKNKIDFNFKDNNGNTFLHNAAFANVFRICDLLLYNKCNINALNNLKETPLYCALLKDNINEKFVRYLINKGAILKPSSYIKEKALVELLSPYEGICNSLVYEPLTLKLLESLDFNYKIKNKIKKIIKILKLKDDDFSDKDKESMVKFIQDILKIKYNNLNVCDISTLSIKENSLDIDFNMNVFVSILSNLVIEDFEQSVKDKGIDYIKELFIERLRDIRNAVPINKLNKPVKPNNPSREDLIIYENSMKEYNLKCIKFFTKKQLYKLGLLISKASESETDKEIIRIAMNIILDNLVCHVGTLGAINNAVKLLMNQDDDNDLKALLSKEIMEFRIRLIEEVARKHLDEKVVCISELGKSIAEYSNHMLAYLVMDLNEELKVTGLHENEFRYEYDNYKSFVINEVNRLYRERLVQEVKVLIRSDAKLSNMVRDYLEREIFKTSNYLMIEDFIHDEEYRIKDSVIKILLIYFGYLKIN